jgi:hypothetical protein
MLKEDNSWESNTQYKTCTLDIRSYNLYEKRYYTYHHSQFQSDIYSCSFLEDTTMWYGSGLFIFI